MLNHVAINLRNVEEKNLYLRGSQKNNLKSVWPGTGEWTLKNQTQGLGLMMLSLLFLLERANKTEQEISQKTAEVLGSRHWCEAVCFSWAVASACDRWFLCSAPFLQWRMGTVWWWHWLCQQPSLLRWHIGYGELCCLCITSAPQMASSSALDSCTCLLFSVQGNWKPGKMLFPAFAQSLNPMKHLQCS